MNTLSRLQSIRRSEAVLGPRPWRGIRIVVDEKSGAEMPRVTLSPGDRLVIENRGEGRLRVAPLDFFGNAFVRFTLRPGETTPAMTVTGLWFQVELQAAGRFHPLDVYLAPND